MRRELAGENRHCRVVAQLVVVDQILIAQGDPEHALPDQRHHLVLNQLRSTAVGKTPGKPLDQPYRPIRRPQQQATCV
jgi:hypothetical protein